MGVELTQWTLVKPGRLGAPRREAEGSIWLKSPSGEMQLLPLANLPVEARAMVAELASGSKVPKGALSDLLAARNDTDSTIEAAVERPWTLHHVDLTDGRYVFLSPPPERGARPVAFPLAGQHPQVRRQLEILSPGDPVSEEIVALLQGSASTGQPKARGLAGAAGASRQR
jgi:hypothetical protein